MINRCPECQVYTMAEECGQCGVKAVSPHPPKFSPEDRYGKYRRRLKKMSGE